MRVPLLPCMRAARALWLHVIRTALARRWLLGCLHLGGGHLKFDPSEAQKLLGVGLG